MKYLFFDIECADGGQATICSFGYVLANEEFKILRREDILINPQGRFFLTGRAGRPDVQLAYPAESFKRAPTFDKFYEKIKMLVENEGYCVVGHSVGDDVKYLNRACARYGLAPLTFRYFDTQRMYREVTKEPRAISLENAVIKLGVGEKLRYHQSVEDARATMLVLKALLEKTGTSFEEYVKSTDRCTGRTEGGTSAWDYADPQKKTRRSLFREERGENLMLRGRKNHTLFLRYLDHGEGIGEKNDRLAGKKVSVSMNYETEHFNEMIILAGMVKAAGGEYVLKASTVDIFATFDTVDENGSARRCSRGEYVKSEIENGRDIKVMTLDEFLGLLGTSRELLESAPTVNVEYLLDSKYGKK